LRAWYASPEPVYLVYYIEANDLFLAEDVRNIVESEWGDEVLNSKLFQDGAEVTVKISTTEKVDSRFWTQLHGHTSMRTDGRSFRGSLISDPSTLSSKRQANKAIKHPHKVGRQDSNPQTTTFVALTPCQSTTME